MLLTGCIDHLRLFLIRYIDAGGDAAFQHSHSYLGANSVVVEIGGNKGIFAQTIVDRYATTYALLTQLHVHCAEHLSEAVVLPPGSSYTLSPARVPLLTCQTIVGIYLSPARVPLLTCQTIVGSYLSLVPSDVPPKSLSPLLGLCLIQHCGHSWT